MAANVSFQTQYNLSNLTAPASGVTHATKLSAVFTTAGTATIQMSGLVQDIGDFQAQAMRVDNSANTVAITIGEQRFGWSRIINAGTAQTFQFPAVADQVFIVTTPGAATVEIDLFDWPAFPDWATISASGGGTPVTIVGTVSVQEVGTQAAPYPALDIGGDAFSVATGGTAVVALTAGHAAAGGYITNPFNATESLFVDPVNAAQNIQGGGTNGTTIELVPGQTYNIQPTANAISVNAVTNGHVFSVVGRT